MAGGKIDILVEPDLRNFPGMLQSGLRSSTGVASAAGRGIGLALTAGLAGAAVGLKQIVGLGTEFEGSLNSLQAVTQATGAQMQAVGARAKELGSDLTLPGTSAADAANAMLELAKGGLTVEQAMAAAKGTLTLAAAAQVDGARAAQIQSDALNIFGLAADQAGHVADVLANSANASAVEISDVAESMKYVGPVARSMGVSLEDTATAIGLLGNAGIRGSEAGTALRGMLASLVAPSGAAGKAIGTLGLQVRDAQGNFVGFPAIIDQLRSAQGRLDKSTFDSAVVQAFGRETMSGVLALVNSAPGSWDSMSDSVTRAGGAQDVAAAKMQGLGGAIEGLQSNLETAAIGIYQLIKGPLEQFVRGATDGVDQVNDVLDKLGTGADLGPVTDLFDDFGGVLDNVRAAARPVADGINAIVDSMSRGSSPASAFGTALGLVGDSAVAVSGVLVPVGDVAGGLLGTFAALPGPVQTAALALLAFRVLPPMFSSVASSSGAAGTALRGLSSTARTIAAPVTGTVGALRQFSGEMRVQQGLATAAGQSLSRLGAAQAAFETSTLRGVTAVRSFRDDVRTMSAAAQGAGAPIGTVRASLQALGEQTPALGRMRDAFRTASAEAGRFGPVLGTVAAAGSGLRSGLSGLVSFLGGPWGLALGAAAVGLSLWASSQQDAAQAVADHKARVDELRGSLDAYSGSATAATRSQVAQEVGTRKLADGTTSYAQALTAAGVSTSDFVDATTGNEQALQRVRTQLDRHVQSLIQASPAYANNERQLAALGISLEDLGAAAQGNQPALDRINDAINRGSAGSLETRSSLELMRDALLGAGAGSAELGRELNTMAGQFGEAQQQAKDAAAANKDFGATLEAVKVGLGGLADATTPQTDLMKAGLTDLATAARDTARAAGENAAAWGGVEQGGRAAAASMQQSRDAFIAAATGAGLTEARAKELANQLGLFPTAVETNFVTNATEATAQINGIGASFAQVPDTKSVTVQALTQEAQGQLQSLGLRVEQLKDGTFRVHADTAEARANLDAFVAGAANTSATITINGQSAPAQTALQTILQQVQTGAASITINGQSMPAQAALSYALGLINSSNGTVTINGQDVPAQSVLSSYIAAVNSGSGTVTIDGRDVPAQDVLRALIAAADGSTGTINVDANADAANREIDNAARDRTATIRVVQIWESGAPGRPGGTGLAAGGIVQPMHDGGVLGMAGGGRLTPMRGGVARMVKPNTWRIIGDRVVDDEAYIPINRSSRSLAIFEETARRMGYVVARRFADGGVAQSGQEISQTIAATAIRSGTDLGVVAAIGRLEGRINTLQRSVQVVQNINVPDAERGADKAAHNMRRLGSMGLFGAPA